MTTQTTTDADAEPLAPTSDAAAQAPAATAGPTTYEELIAGMDAAQRQVVEAHTAGLKTALQAAYDIWGEVRPQIETAFGKLLDSTILYGGTNGYTKPSADWPDGVVTSAVAGGLTVSLAGAADLYDATLGESGTFHFVEDAGFSVNGNVASVNMRAKLRGARNADGQPIFARNPNLS